MLALNQVKNWKELVLGPVDGAGEPLHAKTSLQISPGAASVCVCVRRAAALS